MERITDKQLEHLVERINNLTNNPTVPYQAKDGGGLTANIGSHVLDWAYSGVQLHQITNEGGAINVISNDGYGTKRQLHAFMRGMVQGLELPI